MERSRQVEDEEPEEADGGWTDETAWVTYFRTKKEQLGVT